MAQAPHEPTKEGRNLVKLCAIAGTPQDKIATALGVSIKTLVKYYKKELETAETEFIAQAVGVLAHHMKNKNLTAAIFALKTKGRWREADRNDSQEATDELKPVTYTVEPSKKKPRK